MRFEKCTHSFYLNQYRTFDKKIGIKITDYYSPKGYFERNLSFYS